MNMNCVVEYDGHPYPGIILDVDDSEVEVTVMARIGVNRFFWPLIEDRLWYSKEKVVTLLKTAPQPVTKRHHQIDSNTWMAIAEELNLDS